MGGRGRDWVIGCGFLRARVVFLPLFTLFGGMVLGGVYIGCCGQGFRPIPWSVAVVACVRFRLCRFSVLMVFRLVAASVKLWGEHGVSIGGGWLLSWVCDSGSCREQ